MTTARGARDFDIVIIGAGVIGTVMASLLIQTKTCAPGRVAVVADRLPTAPPITADWDLRVFALSRASERLLKACGVWEALPRARLSAYGRMCVWDARGAPEDSGALTFDCAEIGEANLGFIVEGRALQWECLQAARNAGVAVLEAGIASAAAAQDGCEVRLADGRQLRGQLLVAADGPESATRALLGIETAGHTYHQDALVAHVRTAKPHRKTAWQRFLPGGPLAFLPLADGRSSVVWSVPRADAVRLSTLDARDFGEALTQASGEVLGACELTSAVAAFPLKLQYALHYIRERAVLLGDAAHVVHPLAGQGLNLGLLDCAALAQTLNEAGGAARFGDVRTLRRYERWRRSENLLAAAGLDGLERLFANPDPVSTALRGAGLGLVGKLPFLKRQFAQRALGLTGDVPDLVKTDPG